MGQDNDNKKSTDKSKTSAEYKTQEKEDWLDEHGHPSFDYLQNLAKDGGPGALEKLRSIAADLDAEYGPSDSAQELIEAIRSATRSDPNTTT